MANNFSAWTPSNPVKLGLVLLRSDGKVFNFTSQGWDTLPSGGVPPTANVFPLTNPVANGPLSANWFGTFANIPSNVDNVTACVMSLDGNGGVKEQIDSYPMQYVNYVLGTRGGFSK